MTGKTLPQFDSTVVPGYLAGTERKVPGLADLHRMTMLLLNEQLPQAAEILVVGAGGGMELKAMAQAQSQWKFVGVDPSASMLDLAHRNTESFKNRITLIDGTVEAAPVHKYDGATCLLTLHFLERTERLHTLQQIRRRLKPGARLIAAHHSNPGGNVQSWLARSVAFSQHDGVDWQNALASADSMASGLPLLKVSQEQTLFRQAGFVNVELFYAAFSFRGWVATADPA